MTRVLIADDFPFARKGVRADRRRRERKEHFGELVQLDGSFHPWLEERGAQQTASQESAIAFVNSG
ncbi:MAG: hypothetical protein ACRD8A_13910 [Candidatus Acidiferrales bacterium]